jgi:hypothetical protein
MKRLSCFLLSLSFIPFAVNALGLPGQAQMTKDGQVTNTLTLEEPGKEPVEFSVNGTPERVNPASIVGAISLGGGVELDNAQTAINLVLAGADPDAVANLLLSMGGMIQNNVVDPTRLAIAITAFNTIVDKADLATLTELKAIPEFTDIRTFLADVRKPIF